jgi:hypothetical protein
MNTIVRRTVVAVVCLLAPGMGVAQAAEKVSGRGPGAHRCAQPCDSRGVETMQQTHLFEAHPEADTDNDGRLSHDEVHGLLAGPQGAPGCVGEPPRGPRNRQRAAQNDPCGCGKHPAQKARARCGDCGQCDGRHGCDMHAKPCRSGVGPEKCGCAAHDGPCGCGLHAAHRARGSRPGQRAPHGHRHGEGCDRGEGFHGCATHPRSCEDNAAPAKRGWTAHSGPCGCGMHPGHKAQGRPQGRGLHRAHVGHAGCGQCDGPCGCGKHAKPRNRAAGPGACGCGVHKAHACSECGMHAPPCDRGAGPGKCGCAPHKSHSGCGGACDGPCSCGKPGPRGTEKAPPHGKRCGHKHGHAGWM